jgi:hypothetical protein
MKTLITDDFADDFDFEKAAAEFKVEQQALYREQLRALQRAGQLGGRNG